MTYLEELRQRYKEARRRMESRAIEKPRRAISLPPRMPLQAVEKEELPVEENPPGLVSEKAENEIVSEALNITTVERLGNHAQLRCMIEEVNNSPRLPPLPGLVLNEIGAIRWARILHAVARQHGVPSSEIMGTSRERHIVNARFEVFYRLRIDLAMSYTKIGGIFNRDHTTVMHGVNKVRQKLLDQIKRQEEYGSPALVSPPDQRRTYTPDLTAA